MDKQDIDRLQDLEKPSRPGPKTLVAAVIVGLAITAIYNWAEFKALLDFI